MKTREKIVTNSAVAAIFLLASGCGSALDPRDPVQPTPATQPQVRRESPPPSPTITIKKPEDPNSRIVHLFACARGVPVGCIVAGAWIVERAKAGQTLSVCLRASGPPEDVEHCVGVEAKWPE